jgi:hypothetical protein
MKKLIRVILGVLFITAEVFIILFGYKEWQTNYPSHLVDKYTIITSLAGIIISIISVLLIAGDDYYTQKSVRVIARSVSVFCIIAGGGMALACISLLGIASIEGGFWRVLSIATGVFAAALFYAFIIIRKRIQESS